MNKSTSQIFGKGRKRFELSRKDQLKQLNEQNEKISQFVEAQSRSRASKMEQSNSNSELPQDENKNGMNMPQTSEYTYLRGGKNQSSTSRL